MFTGFYCSAELWGDVVLSLLFWGLANEMTTMEEAPTLYPLFGIGANVCLALHSRKEKYGLFPTYAVLSNLQAFLISFHDLNPATHIPFLVVTWDDEGI